MSRAGLLALAAGAALTFHAACGHAQTDGARQPARTDGSVPAPMEKPSAPRSPAMGTGEQRSAKERLGDKASDEQRVNDCNVPPDRRGSKERPSDCGR
jgi:hypothetical protein